jgi:hypothetical protein
MTTEWKSAAILAALSAVVPCATAGPPACTAGGGSGPVQAPVFVRNLGGQTGWYASPLIADLDGDGFESGATPRWSAAVP